jgi:hypothetical protein
MIKRTLAFGIAIALVAGCSSAPDAERTGETEQHMWWWPPPPPPPPPVCVTTYTGEYIPWLLDPATCACLPGLNPTQQIECGYEQLVASCLQQAGVIPPDCSALNPLPRANASDTRVWTVLDLTSLTSDCGVQQQLYACINGANGAYSAPPVEAQFRGTCAGGGGVCGVPVLDIFDPCAIRSCETM